MRACSHSAAASAVSSASAISAYERRYSPSAFACVGALADALARGRHEHRDVIAIRSPVLRASRSAGSSRSLSATPSALRWRGKRERLRSARPRPARRCGSCCRRAPPRRTATTARTCIAPCAALRLHGLDLSLQLERLHVARLERLAEAAAEAEVAAVEHLRVDVAPDLVEVARLLDVAVEVRHRRDRHVDADAARCAARSRVAALAAGVRERVAELLLEQLRLELRGARPDPSAGSACRGRSSRRCSRRRCRRTPARSACA